MWFTETPWPPMVLFAAAAIACVWMWLERRKSWWLVGGIGCVAVTAAVWVFERAIVTPREQIEQHIVDLARAFQDRDEDEFLTYISPRADRVRAQAALAFLTVTKADNLHISDTDVTLLAAGSRAKLDFRANGTFSVRDYGDIGHQPTRWIMTWQQEGGLWKVIDVERINPITGEPMGLLEARQ